MSSWLLFCIGAIVLVSLAIWVWVDRTLSTGQHRRRTTHALKHPRSEKTTMPHMGHNDGMADQRKNGNRL